MTNLQSNRRWRQHLADERAEAGVYRDPAGRRTGEEWEILLALAEAETRHEKHWLDMLGDKVGKPRGGSLRTRFVGFLARHFGSVFVLALALALARRAEARSPYARDLHRHHGRRRADPRGSRPRAGHARKKQAFWKLPRRRRRRQRRVRQLALLMAISASGASNALVLLRGVAGLLAGALSWGPGKTTSSVPSANCSRHQHRTRTHRRGFRT